MPLSATAMYMNREHQLIQLARVYKASNLFNEKMYSNNIFLPSFEFVNKKILDNTKYPENSTNKYFSKLLLYAKMMLYLKTAGYMNKIFSLHYNVLALGNQSSEK